MGQKVNPHGFRVGVISDWDTQWLCSKKDIAENIKQDYAIRTFLKNKYYGAAISKIVINRSAKTIKISIYTARPSVLIGTQGKEVEIIKKDIAKLVKVAQNAVILVDIVDVKKPDADAQLTAESVASQLEKRIAFRRAMKQCIGKTMRSGAKGIKIKVGGRLDGADIARSESYHEGSIPLQTLRADIDYGFAVARTTFGAIGVKCWIYKGEVIGAGKKRKTEGGEA